MSCQYARNILFAVDLDGASTIVVRPTDIKIKILLRIYLRKQNHDLFFNTRFFRRLFCCLPGFAFDFDLFWKFFSGSYVGLDFLASYLSSGSYKRIISFFVASLPIILSFILIHCR